MAIHLLVVFCAVDLLHTDYCSTGDKGSSQSEGPCPACLFKQGSQAEQPLYAEDLGLVHQTIAKAVALVEQVQSVDVALHLYLRAPPAVS